MVLCAAGAGSVAGADDMAGVVPEVLECAEDTDATTLTVCARGLSPHPGDVARVGCVRAHRRGRQRDGDGLSTDSVEAVLTADNAARGVVGASSLDPAGGRCTSRSGVDPGSGKGGVVPCARLSAAQMPTNVHRGTRRRCLS